MLQNIIFINYGQAVDDSKLEPKANLGIEIKIIRLRRDNCFNLLLLDITFELK